MRGCYPKCPTVPRSFSSCEGQEPLLASLCCVSVAFDYDCLPERGPPPLFALTGGTIPGGTIEFQQIAACAIPLQTFCDEWVTGLMTPCGAGPHDGMTSPSQAAEFNQYGTPTIYGYHPQLRTTMNNLRGGAGSGSYGDINTPFYAAGSSRTECVVGQIWSPTSSPGSPTIWTEFPWHAGIGVSWEYNCYTGLVDFVARAQRHQSAGGGDVTLATGSFPPDWYLAPITLTAVDPACSDITVSTACADYLPCEPIDCFPSCISGTEDCDGVTPTHPFLFVNVAFNGVMGTHNLGYNEADGYFEAGPILTADETSTSYFESVSFRLRCIDGAPDLRVLRRVWHSYDSYDVTYVEYDGPITIECEGGEVTITEGGYLIFSNNNGLL